MPRRARIIIAGVPVHLIQRGNNRQTCFFDEQDCKNYLKWLAEYSQESECAIHAYVLMTNHVHLLLTPEKESSAAKLMKRLGQRYTQYINRIYQRSGTLWEGRFRSCIVQDEKYALVCQRYIELNPVRAQMVSHPGDYLWSSYRTKTEDQNNQVVIPHESYLTLGSSVENRQKNYRMLLERHLDFEITNKVRHATNGNYALGDEKFTKEIEKVLGRRVTPGKAGRPRKNDTLINR